MPKDRCRRPPRLAVHVALAADVTSAASWKRWRRRGGEASPHRDHHSGACRRLVETPLGSGRGGIGSAAHRDGVGLDDDAGHDARLEYSAGTGAQSSASGGSCEASSSGGGGPSSGAGPSRVVEGGSCFLRSFPQGDRFDPRPLGLCGAGSTREALGRTTLCGEWGVRERPTPRASPRPDGSSWRRLPTSGSSASAARPRTASARGRRRAAGRRRP